jgi:hypothetical protein
MTGLGGLRHNAPMAGEQQPEDIVELGGRPSRLPSLPNLPSLPRLPRPPGWRPSRGAAVFAAVALVIGLAAGYVAGDRQARGSAASPVPTASAPTPYLAPATSFAFNGLSPLAQNIGTCSVQTGQELQLGVQVANQSSTSLVLQAADAVLPLGGLEQVAWHWGPCGAAAGGPRQGDLLLGPGASVWLTVTLKVQVRCPSALPVEFVIGYLAQGQSGRTDLPGFSDLSQVPYTGCPATTASSAAAASAVVSLDS